jgi:hypothetical protein
MNEDQPPQPPAPDPPPGAPKPAYPLDYATPTRRTGMPVALKVIVIVLLVFVGLAVLAFGLCVAMLSGPFH